LPVLAAGALIGESTNYFTSYAFKPTQEIAEASATGAGATVIRGFATGLMSTWPPVVLIVIAIVVAFQFGSFYGVALACVGMLSTLGVTLATDAYGPIADNAGGITTQAGLPERCVRGPMPWIRWATPRRPRARDSPSVPLP
jgi:K(+)-stimulated pyrophosphate-energized sodium pump